MKNKPSFIDQYFDEVINDLSPRSAGKALWNLILMTLPVILVTIDFFEKYMTTESLKASVIWAGAVGTMCLIGGVKYILARRGYGCLATLARFVILDIGYLLGIRK